MQVDEDEDFPSPSRKRTRSNAKSNCIIHCTGDVGPLTTVSSIESWKVLLNAAIIRNYQPLLDIVVDTDNTNNVIPNVQYHRQCRSVFTMKSLLDQIQTECRHTTNSNDDKQEVQETSLGVAEFDVGKKQTLLPKTCIICCKQKYVPRTNNKEKLIPLLRADTRIKDTAQTKGDKPLLARIGLGFDTHTIDVDAHYHKSCYINYNRDSYCKDDDKWVADDKASDAADSIDQHEMDDKDKAFDAVVKRIQEIVADKIIIDFVDIRSYYQQQLQIFDPSILSQSSIKNLRRRIETKFGPRLQFVQKPDGKLLMYPNTISMSELVLENVDLKQRNASLVAAASNVVVKAALAIRNDIKQLESSCNETSDSMLPHTVRLFLQTLLTGNLQTEATSRVKRLIWSYGQDFIHSVTVARIKTPKHIMLPYAVKTLTGNVRLITYLNRLGHGLSYSQIEEFDTSIAVQKIAQSEESGLVLPDGIVSSTLTHLAWDNIDRCEATLSGGGTSHRVNGIIVQPLICPNETSSFCVEKLKDRTLKVQTPVVHSYIRGSRVGPGSVVTADPDYCETVNAAKSANLHWITRRYANSSHQIIPSWTGFNVLASGSTPVRTGSIGYLQTIDAPATELTTVLELLRRSIRIKDELQLKSIVCTFDQALYAKAAEIVWKHRTEYSGIILQLGGFHLICNYLSIIGKRFGDAGLRDLLTESDVGASGSMPSVLSGKHYNRGVRMYKLVYEALRRTMIEQLPNWLKVTDPEMAKTFTRCVETDIDLSDEEREAVIDCILKFEEHLRHDNGPTCSLWMSYVDMVEDLLHLLRASREGNWKLYIASIRSIIPWFFAYDHQNYARYLPVYYNDMLKLQETDPDVHEAFANGNFSVQLESTNPFSRLPVDEVIEKTVNLDTQTAGGTKGFSRQPAAVERFYLTSSTRAAFMHTLDQVSDVKRIKYKHADLYPARIHKDEHAVQALCRLLSKEWINPFQFQEAPDMIILSTAVVVPEAISQDLLKAHEKGEAAFAAFTQTNMTTGTASAKFFDTIKRLRLKTCTDLNKRERVNISGREVVLKADCGLFARMAVIAQKRSLNMREVLSFPLGPLPMALANPDGSMRKTQKSQLLALLTKDTTPVESIPNDCAFIIDGMSLVQKVVDVPETFGLLAEKLLHLIIANAGQCKRIDVVFDVYRDKSIKNSERTRRSKSAKAKTYLHITATHRITDWRSFLTSGHNKSVLIEFIINYWSQTNNCQQTILKEFYVTTNDKCYHITSVEVNEVFELFTEQEEADTRLFLHAKHAADCGFKSIVIQSDDTDVAIIGLNFIPQISEHGTQLYMKMGTRNRLKYINLTDIQQRLGTGLCDALIGLHALTGCDTVSAFCGRGKNKGLSCLKRNMQFAESLAMIGKDFVISSDLSSSVQKFVCCLYGSCSAAGDINDVRYVQFVKKKGAVESQNLPPCSNCLQQHIARANYQAAVWHRALQQHPLIPAPDSCGGWITDRDTDLLEVNWMTCHPAPVAVLELLSCSCSKTCEPSKCVCISNGLKCTDICKLTDCGNSHVTDNATSDVDDDSEQGDCETDDDTETDIEA